MVTPKVLKALGAGLLGTSDFGMEAIAHKAGKGIRRNILPAAGVATGTTALVKANHKEEHPVEKTAFWQAFEKKALINAVPGVKNMRQGYRIIDKLQRMGHLMPDGTPTTVAGTARKALAGKAMVHGAAKLTATGVVAHQLLKKKEPSAY